MIRLVCQNKGCTNTKDFADDAEWEGLPIRAWFAAKGNLCESCRQGRKLNKVAVAKGMSIQEQFEAFHALNPWVYRTLVDLTRELVHLGYRKVGIGMLFEVLRWQYMKHTKDPASDFKLNNNLRSRYARMIMDNEPDLDGIYEVRELRAA